MADGSTVDAVIFNGGYGIDYWRSRRNHAEELRRAPTVKVLRDHQIAQELQPRFVGGNPPDLIDNSGENAIGFSTILDQLEDLNDVLDAKNLEGTAIRDTLFGGVEEPGTFDGKFAALNYVLTVYALWYSATLFEENGWTPPKTWDETIALGAEAKKARASTSSSGARRPRPTTRPWPSRRRSSRAATRSGSRWRTSKRTAGPSTPSRPCSRRWARS